MHATTAAVQAGSGSGAPDSGPARPPSAALLRPLGIEAALKAVVIRKQAHADTHHQAELALTQARYEADLARRQFDAVDPANRLVAAELERRWNDRLVDVQRQEERIADLVATHPEALSPVERDTIVARPLPPPVVCVVPAPRFERARGAVRPVAGCSRALSVGYSDCEHRPFGS